MANRPELIHRYEASGGTAGEFEIDGGLAELEPRKECVVISWASGPECLDQVLGHAGRRARISFAISDKLFETRSTRRAARLLRGRRSDVTVFRVDEDETTIVFEVTERRPGELSVAAPTIEEGAGLLRDLGANAIAGWLPDMYSQLASGIDPTPPDVA